MRITTRRGRQAMRLRPGRLAGIVGLLAASGLAVAADVAPAPAATPAPVAATAVVFPPPAGPSPVEIAKRLERARLAREIDRLQQLITSLPEDLDQRRQEVTQARDDLGYESWLITAEGDQVRTSIEQLRVRLTLLESITRNQDQLDRVRMVELQNALVDINTDQAQIEIGRTRAHEELAAITRQLAARQATFERLAEVRRQLDRLTPVAAVAPAGAPAPAATLPSSASAAPPAGAPVPTVAIPVPGPVPAAAPASAAPTPAPPAGP